MLKDKLAFIESPANDKKQDGTEKTEAELLAEFKRPAPLIATINGDLESRGHEPVKLDASIDDVKQSIADVIKKLVRAEIENDPAFVGYAGKNNEEIARLLCTIPERTPEDVQTFLDSNPTPDQRTMFTTRIPRFGVITAGVPFGPNGIDADDVAEVMS